MQWIVGAASVVAAAWRAVAPREVTAAFTGAGECWRPGLAVQRAGSQPLEPMVVATSRRELNTAPLGPQSTPPKSLRSG